MSYLVSDFLINPVLRQARRFSRSNTPGHHVDPLTNQHIHPDGINEDVIENITERVEGLDGLDVLETVQNGQPGSIFGVHLSSSPIREDGGPEVELQALAVGRPPDATAASGPPNAGPLRQTEEGASESPSFDIAGRFRPNSRDNATSFSNSTQNVLNALSTTMSPAEDPSRRSTQELPLSESTNHQRNGSLPADDGMGPLRQQIIMIQALEVPAEQKARMMHRLLTQGYNHAQEMYHAKHQPQPPSPTSMISQERPTTPGSLSSFIRQINGIGDGEPSSQQHTFYLSPDDLKRTYAPLDPLEADEDGVIHPRDQLQALGCQHYKRNVKLQCSTCNRWHTCRLCHDEVEDHVLIRKATKNMLCMLCGCAQRASEACVECGERSAWYYCAVCKLWDNDPNKSIYHCSDCGICRKGRGLGKDFFHCKTCGTCMSMSVEHSHKCIERVSDCDCPICGEYMFTSPRPVVFMLCGHSIHQKCYYEHMKSSYKCPICSKSTVNMETQFRNLDRAIESQPMPPQFQDTKAMVSCNDCYAKSAVKYHWLGLKCAICDSYNTAQLSILSDPAVEVPVIESRATENADVPDHAIGEGSTSALLGPGIVPVRHRRHSSHARTPSSVSRRFSPYPLRQRIGRSVSPVRGQGLFDDPLVPVGGETEEPEDEDDGLDFWGRDEPRSVTSAENMGDDMSEDEESDDNSVSAIDECDDEGDEEDKFELIGHR